jgi:hypothetical protein
MLPQKYMQDCDLAAVVSGDERKAESESELGLVVIWGLC